MGIYDRDYYRRDGPSVLGSFLERGTVCKWLIGINIAMFVVQMLTRPHGQMSEDDPLAVFDPEGKFTASLDLNVSLVASGQVWRLLTYAFLHSVSSPFHIVFNMLALWWFGTDVEELYGSREFLAIYLLSAIAGGVLFTLTTLLTTGGNAVNSAAAIGASGAVTAILVLCAIHFPTRIIYVFGLVPVPIWLFVIGSVAMDSYVLLGRVHNGVAVACHLGGAAFALLYYKIGLRVTSLLPSLRNWKQRRSPPRLRVYREDEEHEPRPQPVTVAAPNTPTSSLLDDEQLEAKMDAVLEKISRVGKDNLTDSEREVLLRASELLKKRRS